MTMQKHISIHNLDNAAYRISLHKGCLATLESYRHLPKGWDGYQADAPKAELIDATQAYAKRLFDEKLMVLSPTIGTSSLGLYWNSRSNVTDTLEYIDFEFEISEANVHTYSVFARWRRPGEPEGELWIEDQPIDGEIDPRLIKYFNEVCKWD